MKNVRNESTFQPCRQGAGIRGTGVGDGRWVVNVWDTAWGGLGEAGREGQRRGWRTHPTDVEKTHLLLFRCAPIERSVIRDTDTICSLVIGSLLNLETKPGLVSVSLIS